MSRSTVVVVSCLLAVVGAGVGAPAAAEGATTYSQFVTVAGTGQEGYSGDGQRATDARVSDGGGIAVGPDGTLYLADEWSGRVRAVNRDGVIDTVPNARALRSPASDGPEVNGWQYSPSNRPSAIAVGADGTLYIAGRDAVVRLAPDGSGATLATEETTHIDDPTDIAVAGGNVYVGGSGLVVRIDAAGAVTTVAGGGTLDALGADGKPATEARLSGYYLRMTVDAHGTVYLVAPQNSEASKGVATLHRVDPDGTLHTVAGNGKTGYAGDGGPVAKAQLSESLGALAVDADGTLYLQDLGNGVVRAIDTHGVITSLTPPLPAGEVALAGYLAVGPHGDLYLKSHARVYKLVKDRKLPTHKPGDQPRRFAGDAPGTVHTVAGSGADQQPDPVPVTNPNAKTQLRLAVGPDGTRYYADPARHRVMKVDGTVIAGTGKAGFAGDGGPAAKAELNTPTGLDVGPDGSVYIADSANFRLRKVDPHGVITTVAGNGTQGDPRGVWGEDVDVHGDGGPATAATVTPSDVAVAGDGSLYLAELDNKRISRVGPDGVITTIAGAGDRWKEDADGHPAIEADLFQPSAVAVGPGGIYLLDNDVETIAPSVRMIDPAGIMRTVAGDSYRDESEAGFSGDGGPGAKAELNNPHDIAVGPDGSVYIADTYNARVRVVAPAGTITTFAGTGQRADTGDKGPATKAAVNEPQSVAVGADGVVHLINAAGDRVRAVSGGVITTTARIGKPRSGTVPATKQAINAYGIAVDGDGGLLITSLPGGPTKVDARGAVSEPFANRPELRAATQMTVGPDGVRYVVVAASAVYAVAGNEPPVLAAGGGPGMRSDDRVVRGQPAPLATFGTVVDLAVSPSGRLFIATSDHVYRLADDGTLAVVFTGDVNGIAVDGEDRLYVADNKNSHVYRVSGTGERTTFAGSGRVNTDDDNGDGGDADDAWLESPTDVAVDASGNVYIGTYSGIRRVDQDGTIMTVMDNPPKDGTYGAIGPLAVDRAGNVYFVDHTDNQVKVVVRPGELANPFNWALVIWLAVGVVVVVAGWFGYRWWRRDKTAVVEKDAEQENPLPPVD